VLPTVHALVQVAPLHREPVLGPHLLDVDEGALAFAEEEVLEGRDGKEVVFGEHRYTHCSTVTPSGRSPLGTVIT
jgi:hypothetical protein